MSDKIKFTFHKPAWMDRDSYKILVTKMVGHFNEALAHMLTGEKGNFPVVASAGCNHAGVVLVLGDVAVKVFQGFLADIKKGKINIDHIHLGDDDDDDGDAWKQGAAEEDDDV